MRKNGCSYNQISRNLNIPKSTLSGWFHNMKNFEKIKQRNISQTKKIWAKNIIAFNKSRSKLCRARWQKIQEESAKEIGRLSLRELLLIGAALYWAEGYKKANWSLVFCNSDPEMVKLMTKFFIKLCKIPKDKIKAQVQIHPNISAAEATKHWSSLTHIPIKQFMKPIRQISKSSKFKRGNLLPYGTFRLRINDVKLVNKIKGWIHGLAVQV